MLRFINAARGALSACYEEDNFSLPRWQVYMAGISPALPGKVMEDAAGYDFRRQILPVLRYVYEHSHLEMEASENFDRLSVDLPQRLDRMPGNRPDADIIFYLGLCNGAGWATKMDGRACVLLGVEKIVELHWHGRDDMFGLIAHELGHLWHDQQTGRKLTAGTQKERSLLRLYDEGMAMAYEQLLMGNDHFFHQDKGGWLSRCRRKEETLKADYMGRVMSGESTDCFFGDWQYVEDISDAGYYLGSRFIHHLLKTKSLERTAALSMKEIEGLFVDWVSVG